MKARTDIKSLIPYFKQEMAKGRTVKDIAEEKNFTKSAYQTMVYYLRRESNEPQVEIYTIRPEKKKQVVSFEQGGKVWYDITPFIIDCGG